jgi:hypothetical protein
VLLAYTFNRIGGQLSCTPQAAEPQQLLAWSPKHDGLNGRRAFLFRTLSLSQGGSGMNSEMAVKIEKGIKYSYEPERFEFTIEGQVGRPCVIRWV